MTTFALRGLLPTPPPPLFSIKTPLPALASSTSSSVTKDAAPLTSPLNGPLSTRPPPLELPKRNDPPTSTIKYYIALGKAYATFYKTGAKAIYANFRASQPIQDLVDTKHASSLPTAVSANALTRSEFQLLCRNWHDIKRVPIFGLVFILCGEFTPLVVIALSSVVPWTCRIPKQIDADRKKLEKRRGISFRNLTVEPPTEKGVDALERMQVLHVSWSLGLSSSAWDWLGGQYPGLPTWVLRRKVASSVEYLEMDDKLLGDPKRVDELEPEEVRMALVERGGGCSGKALEQFES
ncbi:hypothetical protein LHYA1_G006880 [Lachnellula hyalina]|uniref:Letm1 RBD domain-containing protein n=1 Tax=Lachnellula hyalina TaxID=1316788 RepID=A0A8H8TZ70_9HELO|nr:uncharacterized protein LHYA1_G006880 [Lachnellula hyalina]TVY24656.1 hypothetical protein LHYA1_G006880 [Lachnellula hyalina]